MGNKSEQLWAALYIYWVGVYLHFLYPNYAKNTDVHTLDIRPKFMHILDIIKRYKSITEIWKTSSKNLYSVLLKENLYLSKIQTDFKAVNSNILWKSSWSYKTGFERTLLYRYIFSVVPWHRSIFLKISYN